MSRIIFLDVDGVLNSTEVAYQIKRDGINNNGFGGFFKEPTEPTHSNVCWGQELVDNLKYIIEKTNAKVVISSTWRVNHKWKTFPKMFALYGFPDIEIIGATPKLNIARGYEIREWLHHNKDVEKYVILDDNSDMLESQMPFFVKTDLHIGLTKENAEKAINILNS